MTEQHLREARSNLDDHIEIGRKRDRRRSLGLVAAAAVVVPIIGVVAFQAVNDGDTSGGPTTPPPTQQGDPYADFLVGSDPSVDLVTGVWRVDNGYMLLWFRADGTMQFNDSGGLFNHPSTTATYQISGDGLAITTTREGTDGAACEGSVMPMRASLPESVSMHMVNTNAPQSCSLLPTGGRWVLEKILPSGWDYSEFMPPDKDYSPVARPALLYGDWAAATGDQMVELNRDGTYTVVGGAAEVLDTGTWTFADRDLQLVSEQDSPSCEKGDRLVLGGLTHGDAGPSEFIRGTIAANQCGGVWAKTDWLLLPNDHSE